MRNKLFENSCDFLKQAQNTSIDPIMPNHHPHLAISSIVWPVLFSAAVVFGILISALWVTSKDPPNMSRTLSMRRYFEPLAVLEAGVAIISGVLLWMGFWYVTLQGMRGVSPRRSSSLPSPNTLTPCGHLRTLTSHAHFRDFIDSYLVPREWCEPNASRIACPSCPPHFKG